MTNDYHPLTEQIQEAFTISKLPPVVTRSILDKFNAYFVENIVDSGDFYPDMVQKLYALDDNQRYSIIVACGPNNYDFYTMPAVVSDGHNLGKGISQEAINLLKQEYQGIELSKQVSFVNSLVRSAIQLLDSSTRSTRQAIANSEEPVNVVFPELAELKLHYECGRKVAYNSFEMAMDALEKDNNAYLCKHCHQYHQGRASVLPNGGVPDYVMLGRYRKIWRRTHNV